MIKPRVDKLLEHTDSHYAAVVVAASSKRTSDFGKLFDALLT